MSGGTIPQLNGKFSLGASGLDYDISSPTHDIEAVAAGAIVFGGGQRAVQGRAPWVARRPGLPRGPQPRARRPHVKPFSGNGNKLGGASSASKRKPLVKKIVVKKKAAPASKPKAAVVVDDKWSCARCTFLNEKEHLACGMCAGERCQTDFTE